MSSINFKVITMFPELFPGPLNISIVGNALKKNLWTLETINIRSFTKNNHKSIDDFPAGGGSGMIIKADVLGDAIDSTINKLSNAEYSILYLSPRGKLLNQKKTKSFIQQQNIILICGRFEGIDQRVIDHYKIEEVSIGDYIISGGELAAYILIDSCVRVLPGVLGNNESISEESFSVDSMYENLLEYPQYTKPNEWRGIQIPEILLSGNHQKIKQWRLSEAQKLTKKVRPDLL